ncbi:MAG: hypothetical protein A3I66_22845 [Burkholderiales bacterium RIFCSPLOWO2_02_FULL_57_36]|nr:MAG: hypothetical protein A3I66_22845 [Burkholderiales bacterium RIFCSPLOWO2_02_FULL_57_36]
MAFNRTFSSLVIVGVLAASVSTAAFAGDRHHHNRGNGAAIAAGILGAVVIGSLIANSQPAHAAPQPYYEAQPQAYYPPQPVQQVYYGSQPQYYEALPAVYVRGGYRERHEYRRYRHHDRHEYRRDRDHDRHGGYSR